jgi:L1 cell adhesion molecule like protein
MADSILGIKFGNTNTFFGVANEKGPQILLDTQGEKAMPSVIAFNDIECLIGTYGFRQSARNPYNTFYDLETLLGRTIDDPIIQNNRQKNYWRFNLVPGPNREILAETVLETEHKTYRIPELIGKLFAEGKSIAMKSTGKSINETVLTIPWYYNDTQRTALKQACQFAKLNLLGFITDPFSALIANDLNTPTTPKRNVLVIKCGGSQLDLAIISRTKARVKVQRTLTDSTLGGRTIDLQLLRYVLMEFQKKTTRTFEHNFRSMQRVLMACENCKKRLSSQEESEIIFNDLDEGPNLTTLFTRADLNRLCEPLFTQILTRITEICNQTGIEPANVHDIIPVGGTLNIPQLQKKIRMYFLRSQYHTEISPEEVLVRGAVKWAKN